MLKKDHQKSKLGEIYISHIINDLLSFLKTN